MQEVAQVRESRSEAGMAAWARRPGDKVFDNVGDLVEYTRQYRDNSFVRDSAVEQFSICSLGDSLKPGVDPMILTHPTHDDAVLNNHSFNQFCGLIGARAGEYKKLPAAIAQIPLAWLAQHADRKDAKALFYRDPLLNAVQCRALHSATYGRIWNHELATAIQEYIDPEVWTIPNTSAFHMKTGFITANDRKVFVFMADEKHPIELPGSDRRAFRGFYAWNSEVGDGSAGIAEFLFFDACANRAIMGLSEFEELHIRHTGGAPDRWLNEAAPKLKEYCNSSPKEVQRKLLESREKKVARSEKGALEWLMNRGFTKATAQDTVDLAREGESGADSNASPYSLFNLVMGATARARRYANNDERVDAERQAGKLMNVLN